MGVVWQVQVPDAFLNIVSFEWAKFQKRVVLPFTETFPPFHKGVLIILWKPLGV